MQLYQLGPRHTGGHCRVVRTLRMHNRGIQ